MSAGERAAKVDAEFEEAYALGPKKEDGYVISVSFINCSSRVYRRPRNDQTRKCNHRSPFEQNKKIPDHGFHVPFATLQFKHG